jgi:hypothetical protein
MTSRQRDLWPLDELQPDRAMRYYFHLLSETSVQLDPIGRELADLDAVREHAVGIVRDLVKRGSWDGWSVSVINAENAEVLRLPFVDAIRITGRTVS